MELNLHRRVVGITCLVAGAAGLVFAVLGLGVAALQRAILSVDSTPQAEGFRQMQGALWSVWSVHLPIWAAHGAALAIAGVATLKRHPLGAAAAAALTAIAFVTLPLYALDTLETVVPAWEAEFARHPMVGPGGLRPMMRANLIIMGVVLAVPLTAFTLFSAQLTRRLLRSRRMT